MFSPRDKLQYLNDGCDVCIVKERSIPARVKVHVPSLTGYVGEKLYIDLVSMSDTVRGNRYILTAEDSFSRYCHAYPIPNKEAKVLVDQHFNIFGRPDQVHSDNGREFLNNLWKVGKNCVPSLRYSTLQHHPIIRPQILLNVSTELSLPCSEQGEKESKIIGIYGLMCQCSRIIPP